MYSGEKTRLPSDGAKLRLERSSWETISRPPLAAEEAFGPLRSSRVGTGQRQPRLAANGPAQISCRGLKTSVSKARPAVCRQTDEAALNLLLDASVSFPPNHHWEFEPRSCTLGGI